MVYVNDIVIKGNDTTRISQLKEHLFYHFQTKDLDYLKCFLGIEMDQSKEGVVASQRKYVLGILETRLENCKLVDSPKDQIKKGNNGPRGETFSDPRGIGG